MMSLTLVTNLQTPTINRIRQEKTTGHRPKRFALVFLPIAFLMVIPLVHASTGPVITCNGLAGNPYQYTLSATIGGYSSGRQIVHATVDWGDGTANILTVSTGTCPSSTFVAHFGTDTSPGHTYPTPKGLDQVWYNVTMTLMDNAGQSTATWQLFWIQDPPASAPSGGDGQRPPVRF